MRHLWCRGPEGIWKIGACAEAMGQSLQCCCATALRASPCVVVRGAANLVAGGYSTGPRSRGQWPGRDEVQIYCYHRHTVPNWWDGATTPVIDPE